MMTSTARAQVNRDNASNSTGPKTEKGKRNSCMNGFKHGLTGQRMILQDHEVDAYRRLSAALEADYQPQNEIESQLVQHIIDCNMRLNRAAAIDANLLNVGLVENTNEDAPDAITESVIAQTRAWVQQENSFDKLGRYEARLSRQLIQYTRELDRIQNLRKSSEPAESKTGNDELASLRTNGQALSQQAVGQGRIAVVGASLRTKPKHWVPQAMTAVNLRLSAFISGHESADMTTAPGRNTIQNDLCGNLSASLAA